MTLPPKAWIGEEYLIHDDTLDRLPHRVFLALREWPQTGHGDIDGLLVGAAVKPVAAMSPTAASSRFR